MIFTSTSDQMAGYWLNEYFPVAMARSTEQMPSMASVLAALADAGFTVHTVERYGVRPDLQDLFLYSGKHRPELYLSETTRQGISTFSTLADPLELEEGCERLARDVESGRIREVVELYANDGGDYAFFVASV